MNEYFFYESVINPAQINNHINTQDIENSLNSTLINNVENKVKKIQSELYFYKYLTCYLSIIIVTLLIMFINLILNVK